MLRDLGRTLISREQISARVEEMAVELAGDLERDLIATGHEPDESGSVVLIPILTGSIVFVADLIRHMPMKLSLGLVAVSSYPGKSLESKGAAIRGELPPDLADKHVVIVDDILDSGQTLALVKKLVAEQGPASVRVCAFLHKKIEGYEPPLRADYVGFEIPNEFVVGYGLDYDGYYRNHPEIVTLNEEAL